MLLLWLLLLRLSFLGFSSILIGLNSLSTDELTVVIHLDFLLSIKINRSPCSRLVISQIFSSLNFTGSSLNKGVAIYGSADAVECGELPFFDWSRLDDSLKTIFFAVFEGTKLHNFAFDVNKDAHSVRLKVFVDVQVLTPEEHSLVVALLDEMSFGILSLQYELIIRKVLELVIKLPVLFEAVSDISVQARNLLFDSSQVLKDL